MSMVNFRLQRQATAFHAQIVIDTVIDTDVQSLDYRAIGGEFGGEIDGAVYRKLPLESLQSKVSNRASRIESISNRKMQRENLQ